VGLAAGRPYHDYFIFWMPDYGLQVIYSSCLDAGGHEGWIPYLGTPEHWNHGDRPENDYTEMRVSSFFTFVDLSCFPLP